MPIKPAIPTQLLIDAVIEHPGLSGYEIGEILEVDSNQANTRLNTLASKPRIPQIKRVRIDGLYRFYPFSFKVQPSPFEGKSSQTINVGGEAVRIVKVTAEDLAKIERSKSRGKYSEITDAIEELEVDEAIVVPLTKVSRNGVTDSVRRVFKDSNKTFSIHRDPTYVTILRTT